VPRHPGVNEAELLTHAFGEVPEELAHLITESGIEKVDPGGKVHLIVGLGHGDEGKGKGKVAQYIGQYCDFGMRTQGGKNAGHTVYLRFNEFDIQPIEGQDGKEVNIH
jgi:hypothetical protein